MATRHKLAIVLSGGGARAAYQAGVLQGDLRMEPARRAFAVRDRHRDVVGRDQRHRDRRGRAGFPRCDDATLRAVAAALHAWDIYRTDAWSLGGSGARWLVSFVPAWRHRRPASLLDNAPLGDTCSRGRCRSAPMQARSTAELLEALAITAMSYRSGLSVTFCQARPDVELWVRSQRVGVHTTIGVPHLLASSAIPFVFPPAAIDGEYFGDGTVRQVAPTSPALHLGADRILVVGAARSSVRPDAPANSAPPSMAQIGGQVLASIFTDALGTDLEKVRLVNTAVRQIPQDVLGPTAPCRCATSASRQ